MLPTSQLQLRLCAFLHVCSTKEHSQVLTSSLQSLEKREGVLQDKLGSLENQHVQDASKLRMQLDQAQAHTHTLQKEVYTFGFNIRLKKGKYSFYQLWNLCMTMINGVCVHAV